MMDLSEYFNQRILLQKEQYHWLNQTLANEKIQVHRIANFGCQDGTETLTLGYILGVQEAWGIDKNEVEIMNAQRTLKTIQDIKWTRGVPTNAPAFLRQQNIEHAVKFYTGDIKSITSALPSEYFDLAFCHFVLYHIWLDQGGGRAAQSAVQEMARVVRAGGIIAASEPTVRAGKFEINFEQYFEANGLKPLHIESKSFAENQDTKYFYVKDSTT